MFGVVKKKKKKEKSKLALATLRREGEGRRTRRGDFGGRGEKEVRVVPHPRFHRHEAIGISIHSATSGALNFQIYLI